MADRKAARERTAPPRLIARLDAGGLLMQPDGARAYGSSSRDNAVVVIDLKTLEVVGRIDAGRNPDGLAWTTAP